jgi:hypothetical protein
MPKEKTLGECWDAGLVQGSGRLSDGELLSLADRTESHLAAYPPGSLRARREGRPRKGEQAQSTTLRSIRLGKSLWALVAIAADEAGVSVNKWVEQSIAARLHLAEAVARGPQGIPAGRAVDPEAAGQRD